jgi:hypothetical protein
VICKSGFLIFLVVCPVKKIGIELMVHYIIHAVKHETEYWSEIHQIFWLFDFGHEIENNKYQSENRESCQDY